jgi:hypothetical protein
LVSSLELNEVRAPRGFLSEFQTAARDVEVGVALLDDAAIRGIQSAANVERPTAVWVRCLQLDIPARRFVDGHGQG